MGFSAKAKNYFYIVKNLTNREIAKQMDDYSEALVSRYINSDKVSPTFIMKVRAYFPDADIDNWIKEDEVKMVKEPDANYEVNAMDRIDKIIQELQELKETLSQK